MADTTALLTLAEAEQHDFVTLTRALTDDQWAAPSLCAKWTVREVVMHTSIHTHQTLRESVKASREAVRRRDEPTLDAGRLARGAAVREVAVGAPAPGRRAHDPPTGHPTAVGHPA